MRKYRLMSKKGEGTFSEVFKAQNVSSGRCFAIKCMKRQFTDMSQVNKLREIQALRRLSPHPNIIGLEEVLYDKPTGRLALVFELMEATLLEVIEARRYRRPLSHRHVAAYMYQLLRALEHMHDKAIFHRDIKPENILLSRTENGGHVLKVADYGSCRGIYSRPPYTEYISTRWYRSPEVLLTDGHYGAEMDIWATGCVMFETVALFPLFPGTTELDMISRIHHVLGSPPTKLKTLFHRWVDWAQLQHTDGAGIANFIPHADKTCQTLIEQMVTYDIAERISATDALAHPFLSVLSPMDRRLLDGEPLEDMPIPDDAKVDGRVTPPPQRANPTGTQEPSARHGVNCILRIEHPREQRSPTEDTARTNQPPRQLESSFDQRMLNGGGDHKSQNHARTNHVHDRNWQQKSDPKLKVLAPRLDQSNRGNQPGERNHAVADQPAKKQSKKMRRTNEASSSVHRGEMMVEKPRVGANVRRGGKLNRLDDSRKRSPDESRAGFSVNASKIGIGHSSRRHVPKEGDDDTSTRTQASVHSLPSLRGESKEPVMRRAPAVHKGAPLLSKFRRGRRKVEPVPRQTPMPYFPPIQGSVETEAAG